jgi:hypothetical protein
MVIHKFFITIHSGRYFEVEDGIRLKGIKIESKDRAIRLGFA